MACHQHRAKCVNFLRAAGFFLSAISFAFLAEVGTLALLGIGNLTEPYCWLVIVLTSIPFVLISFVLVSRVAPLSLKDVLHLSFYPIGAMFGTFRFGQKEGGFLTLGISKGRPSRTSMSSLENGKRTCLKCTAR